MVSIFKKLAEAFNNYICVIKLVLDPLRLDSRIEEGSQEIDVIAFYDINVNLELIDASFDGMNEIVIEVLA